MDKAKTLCLILGFMLAGCATGATGSEQPETATGSTEPAIHQDVKGSKKANARKACTHHYGKEVQLKNGDRICCLLEETGRELARKASRTITPNKNNKQVKQVGKQFVASYIHVDPEAVSTSMTPSKVTKGNYVGNIRYTETTYECKGKTKKEALASSNCTQTKNRNVTEMINFDGKKWNY